MWSRYENDLLLRVAGRLLDKKEHFIELDIKPIFTYESITQEVSGKRTVKRKFVLYSGVLGLLFILLTVCL